MPDYLFNINWIDILIIILLVRTSYVGFTKGFSYEFLTLLALLCSVMLSIHSYSFVASYLTQSINLPIGFSNFISFVILALGSYFILSFLKNFLHKFINLEMFPKFERIGGIILGFARGAVIASLVLLSMMLIPNKYLRDSIMVNSMTSNVFIKVAPTCYEYVVNWLPKYKLVTIERRDITEDFFGAEENNKNK